MKTYLSFFSKPQSQCHRILPKLPNARMSVAQRSTSPRLQCQPSPPKLQVIKTKPLNDIANISGISMLHSRRIYLPKPKYSRERAFSQRIPRASNQPVNLITQAFRIIPESHKSKLLLVLFLILLICLKFMIEAEKNGYTETIKELTEEKLLQEATQLLRQEKIGLAIQLFSMVHSLNPKNIKAYEGLIECHLYSNDFKQVLHWFNIAEENQCTSDRLKFLLSKVNRLNIDIQFYKTTEVIYETLGDMYFYEAFKSEETDAKTKINVALKYYLKAQEVIQKGIQEIELKLANKARKNQMKFLSEIIDSTKEQLYRFSVDLKNIKFFSLFFKLAECYILINEYQLALKCTDKLLSIEENSDLRYWRGRCLKELGRYEEALENFDRAMTAENALAVHKNKGFIFFNLQFFEQAIHSFKQAIDSVKTCQEISAKKLEFRSLLGLGLSYLCLNESKLAMECFESAYIMSPDRAESYAALAGGHFHTDKSKRSLALKMQQEAIRLVEENPAQYPLEFRLELYYDYAEMLYVDSNDKLEVKDQVLAALEKATQLLASQKPTLGANEASLKKAKAKIENAKNFYESKFSTNIEFTLSKLIKKINDEKNNSQCATLNINSSIVESSLKNEASVLNENHENALLQAIKNKKFQAAEMYIQIGVAINIASLQRDDTGNYVYPTAIELATKIAREEPHDQEAWNLVANLIRHREKFTAEQIEPYLKVISSNQQINELAAKNEAELAINLLVHDDISNRMNQHHIHKYLGHLMDRAGTIDEVSMQKTSSDELHQYKLSAWNPIAFYSLHLNSYLHIYAQKSNEIPPIGSNPREIYEHSQMKKALHNEILLDLETLRCKRDGDIVRGILKSDVSNDVKKKIKRAYIDNIKTKILQLKENENYVFYTGKENHHGMYICFSYDSKTGLVHRRIDNLGEASEKHLHEGDKIWPCQLPPLNKKQLGKYLRNVFDAYGDKNVFKSMFKNIFPKNRKQFISYVKKIQRNRPRQFIARDRYSHIYNATCSKPNQYTPGLKQQSVPNCLVKNESVGEQIRMGRYLYEQIKECEVSLAQELDRKIKQDSQKAFDETINPSDFLDTKSIHAVRLFSFKI